MAGPIRISRASIDYWKIDGAMLFSASDDDGPFLLDVSNEAWAALTQVRGVDPIAALEALAPLNKGNWETVPGKRYFRYLS